MANAAAYGRPTRADAVISNGNLKTGSKKGTIKANISEDNGALKRNAVY